VVISTAHALKFSQFKVDYHTGGLEGVNAHYANPPQDLPATYDAVQKALEKLGARGS
jgi:threonine synthase